jgi:hypothetical protein
MSKLNTSFLIKELLNASLNPKRALSSDKINYLVETAKKRAKYKLRFVLNFGQNSCH